MITCMKTNFIPVFDILPTAVAFIPMVLKNKLWNIIKRLQQKIWNKTIGIALDRYTMIVAIFTTLGETYLDEHRL